VAFLSLFVSALRQTDGSVTRNCHTLGTQSRPEFQNSLMFGMTRRRDH
jgi:hypothetical protein